MLKTIVNDYLICFLLLCSLALLYKCRDRFEKKVLSLLSLSIVLMILGELLFTFYIHMDENPSVLALFIKFLSFYLVYKAVVNIGFEEPLSLLFRELRIREENTRQKAFFLEDEYAHICKMIGVNKTGLNTKVKALTMNTIWTVLVLLCITSQELNFSLIEISN